MSWAVPLAISILAATAATLLQRFVQRDSPVDPLGFAIVGQACAAVVLVVLVAVRGLDTRWHLLPWTHLALAVPVVGAGERRPRARAAPNGGRPVRHPVQHQGGVVPSINRTRAVQLVDGERVVVQEYSDRDGAYVRLHAAQQLAGRFGMVACPCPVCWRMT